MQKLKYLHKRERKIPSFQLVFFLSTFPLSSNYLGKTGEVAEDDLSGNLFTRAYTVWVTFTKIFTFILQRNRFIALAAEVTVNHTQFETVSRSVRTGDMHFCLIK